MKKPRRSLSLLLALIFTLALIPTALADESTTTRKSASKDQDARTEIYAVTQTPGSDYPYFGAKNEPNGGVYYGRIILGGNLPNGRYGAVNLGGAGEESAVGLYYNTADGNKLSDYSYLYTPSLEDSSRALLINVNFDYENDDCANIVNGNYDTKLREAFTHLGTLSNPVFIRIGGEQNIWSNRTTGDQYIPAYRHVADLARTCAPNAALVFSINYMGHNGIDTDSFYPGDEYVDWVGASLYFDHYHHSGDTKNDQFYGTGTFGDPLLNIQQTVNLSKLHNKPIIITEGGAATVHNGADDSAWAAERMQRAFSFLPMVYPQIKAVIMSDYHNPGENNGYIFYNNSTVTSAVQKSVNANPTYLHSGGTQPSYYTRLSAYTGEWSGNMQLAAYTYAAEKQTATWSIDGQTKATVSEYPYSFTLDTNSLSAGKHTVKVTFSNGATKSYEFRTRSYNANPTDNTLYVNGAAQTPTVYMINENNYFKLRDVAMLLNGSERQFALDYDDSVGAVQVIPGQPYTPNGSELAGLASGGGRDAAVSSDVIYINGVRAEGLTVYQIDGSNYFKLRDLGKLLDFYVGWDPATNSISISGNAGYQD